jgi:hypothetical protein
VIGASLAVLTSWPLAARIATSLPESGDHTQIGDPYLVAWQIAWEGHALRTDPLNLFDANYFYPLENSLAFLDPLHGFAPVAVIGSGPDAAVVRFNLLVLFAYALAFIGPYLLARELGVGPFASIVAGAAFAYAPWRLDQLGHLLVISSGGIPLALFMLVRGYRRSRWGWVLAGWLTATWQLSIGYTLGLQLAYLLGGLGVVSVVGWFLVGRPSIPRAVMRATVAGAVLFVVWGGVQAIPTLQVAKTHPEAARSEGEVDFYSPPLRSFRATSANNLLWKNQGAEIRATLSYATEQTLFPGLTVMSLAIVGLICLSGSRALRIGLGLGTLLFGYLALGFKGPGGAFLYRLLFHHAPGWDGIRTPGRLMTIATLFLALLAALGLQLFYSSLRTRFSGSRLSFVPVAVAICLAGTIVLEGWGPTSVLPVSEVSEAQTRAEEPIAQVPMDDLNDRLYMYWSTANFSRMVNGVAAFTPQEHAIATGIVNAFPDQASVKFLRDLGVRSVIVNLALMPNAAEWERVATPIARGLGLEVQRVGEDLVYSLTP